MQALVTEIWLFMAGAGLICGTTVWILGRFRMSSLTKRLEKNWQTRMRASEDSWTSKLRSAEQNFSSQLDQKVAEISLLKTDFQTEKGGRLAMADELAKWKSDMADLLEEQDLISAKLRRMDERLAVALEDADQLDLEVKRLKAEVGELEHEAEGYKLRAHLLEPLEQQVRDLEAALAQKSARIDELRTAEDVVTERTAQIAMLESEHRAEIDRSVQEASRLRARVGELEPRAARLESELAAARDAQARLEDEVQTLRSRRSTVNGGLAPPPHSQDGPKASQGGDDLKKIAGVGPVLERTLYGLGIVTYRQIAGWGAADIAQVSDRLEGFHDRIRRDDWVGQARRLHLETYGEYI